jgi:gentisate 1,2-dioxygenase
MSQTVAPAHVCHYYQRLAELSMMPFWQRAEITEPSGPEHGHAWHRHDVYPELARSREIADRAAAVQRHALILRNPRLTPAAAGATATTAAAYQMLFPGESIPVHAHSISALRFVLAGSGARIVIDRDRVPTEPGDLILVAAIPAWTWHQVIAADDDLIAFRETDRPIHDAFGPFQAEETGTIPSAAQGV